MLPATKTHRFSLADVMPSCLAALRRQQNSLSLPPVSKAVIVLADGLGATALAARAGHARTLAPVLYSSVRGGAPTTIGSRFPTTTASALATLTTGETPGKHGLVGYSVLDAAHDRVVNQLTGWGATGSSGATASQPGLDPETWQRCATIFQAAKDVGIPSFIVGPERYRSSGFTRAVLRGASYRAASSIADRLEMARLILDENSTALLYVYVPELDQIGHNDGWQSDRWTAALEELDSAVRSFSATLRRDEGLLLTSDHGVLDVPQTSHVLFDQDPTLVDGIRFVAGEPRALQLHFEPDATHEHRARVLERWRETEGSRSWIVGRDEAVASGWFGPVVDAEVVPRIGDIIVAARKAVAYYDSRVVARPGASNGRSMIGQHGSWTADETSIPLLRFGVFAA